MDPITLTVATFNDFGYTDALLQEYTDLHPNVTVVPYVAATSDDARANYLDKVVTGGLADVEAVEGDWLPEVMQYTDSLADLTSPAVDGRWFEWETAPATDADGRLIAYGAEIGPEAVCYDAALFADAGLPAEPEEVALLLEGTWSNYFDLGQQYAEATGKAWFDGAAGVYRGMINQEAVAYEDPGTGEITATTNPAVKVIYDELTAVTPNISAHLTQGSDEWLAGVADGDFATILCTPRMLDVIRGAAPRTRTWSVADVFPGGGGNGGGSYLTVPASGDNVDAAKDLAAWLTAPEQQIEALAASGAFPSQVRALENVIALNEAMAAGGGPTNAEFFDSDALGAIFSNRANAVRVPPFKGEYYPQVNDAMQNALTRVEDGSQDQAASWGQFVAEVEAIG